MTRALLVVDVQNDFCEGGSLAVTGGSAVAAAITEEIRTGRAGDPPRWQHIAATRDHHVDPGAHFGDPPDYVDSWPIHCVAGTGGAELHPNLDREPLEAVFDKGDYAAAYSGFEGKAEGVTLAAWLRERGVTDVDVVGLATDHCVRATALDAAREGFRTHVILNLTAGVAQETVDKALVELRAAGITLTGSPYMGSAAADSASA